MDGVQCTLRILLLLSVEKAILIMLYFLATLNTTSQKKIVMFL